MRAVIQPNGTLKPLTWGAPGWESQDVARGAEGLRRAGESVHQQGPHAHRRAAARERVDRSASRGRSLHNVKFFEKGDRPLEIITSRQWFIKTMEFREALHRARPRAAVASGVHAHPLRELGERPERRLVHQPAALLRRAVSGVVSAEQRRPAATTPGRSCRTNRGCRSIRPPTRPTGSPPDQRGPAGRIRRRSGRHGHVGDFVADAADRRADGAKTTICSRACFRWTCGRRRTTSSARGCSPRVLRSHLEHDSLPWRHAAISGFVTRSRSQEDVEVERQRRHAVGAARGARLRRRAVLGGRAAVPARTPSSIPARCASAGGWR